MCHHILSSNLCPYETMMKVIKLQTACIYILGIKIEFNFWAVDRPYEKELSNILETGVLLYTQTDSALWILHLSSAGTTAMHHHSQYKESFSKLS